MLSDYVVLEVGVDFEREAWRGYFINISIKPQTLPEHKCA